MNSTNIEKTALREAIVPHISDTTAKHKAKRVVRDLTRNAEARAQHHLRLCDTSRKKGERKRYLEAYKRAYGSMCRLIYQDKKVSSFMRLTVSNDADQCCLALAVDHFNFRRPELSHSTLLVSFTTHALQRLLQRYPEQQITTSSVFELTQEVASIAIYRTPIAREGVMHLDNERGALAYVFDGSSVVIKTYMPPHFNRSYFGA